jgi:hypothetical protein
MYGGRVIDDFDRRIVRVYMDEYMGDFLFDTFQPFHFYHDENVDYKIPIIAQLRHEFIGEFSILYFAYFYYLDYWCVDVDAKGRQRLFFCLNFFFATSLFTSHVQYALIKIHKKIHLYSHLIDNRIHRLAASRQHTGSVRFASKC